MAQSRNDRVQKGKLLRQAKQNLGLRQVMVWIPMGAAYKTSLDASVEALCQRYWEEQQAPGRLTSNVLDYAKIKAELQTKFVITDEMQTGLIDNYGKDPPGSAIKTIKYWLSVHISEFKGQALTESVINKLSDKIGSRVGYRLQDIILDEQGTLTNVTIVAAWDWKPL